MGFMKTSHLKESSGVQDWRSVWSALHLLSVVHVHLCLVSRAAKGYSGPWWEMFDGEGKRATWLSKRASAVTSGAAVHRDAFTADLWHESIVAGEAIVWVKLNLMVMSVEGECVYIVSVFLLSYPPPQTHTHTYSHFLSQQLLPICKPPVLFEGNKN